MDNITQAVTANLVAAVLLISLLLNFITRFRYLTITGRRGNAIKLRAGAEGTLDSPKGGAKCKLNDIGRRGGSRPSPTAS